MYFLQAVPKHEQCKESMILTFEYTIWGQNGFVWEKIFVNVSYT